LGRNSTWRGWLKAECSSNHTVTSDSTGSLRDLGWKAVHHPLARCVATGSNAKALRGMTVSDPAELDDPENWHGAYYELAIELSPRDDIRLEQALRAVWEFGDVEGCQAIVNRDPLRHGEAELSLASLEEHYLHGVVRLPGGERVVCGAISVREEEGSDWLDFVLPLGALARADARVGSYPFGGEPGDPSFVWRRPIDDWLVSIALRLFDVVPYQLALVGFDVSGELSASEVAGGVPEERGWGIVAAGTPPTFHPATH